MEGTWYAIPGGLGIALHGPGIPNSRCPLSSNPGSQGERRAEGKDVYRNTNDCSEHAILSRYFAIAILAFALLLLVPRVGAAEILLRCRWASPNDRRQQEIAYAANPLLVVLPGENLQLSCDTTDGTPGAVTVMKDGAPVRQEPVVTLTAPDAPGSYYISLALDAGGLRRETEICVLVPYKASGKKAGRGIDLHVDNHNVGNYRLPANSGNVKVRENPDSYQPPVWWLRITPMNRNFELVPGFAAGDLVIPSEDTGLPHSDLAPVCYPMWKAVHTLRTALAARGIPAHSLRIISCFRAPPYNRSVGSNAYGRHIYGDAFDFYITPDGGEKAADLNRDGKLDRLDAFIVVGIIEDLQDDGKIPMGGIGIYHTVAGDHEVTMHLDMRGHRATWCYRTGASGKRSEHPWASRRFAELDRHEENLAAQRAAKEGRPYSRPKREPLP